MVEELRTMERTMRVVVGVLFLYASYLMVGIGSLTMAALGLYAIVTGFLGNCYICNIIRGE